jgi:hypothetical protein
MSFTTDVRQDLIDLNVKTANEQLGPNAKLHYFGRDTESGSARIVLYTEGESGGSLVCVGSPRECWQFLTGLLTGLQITS